MERIIEFVDEEENWDGCLLWMIKKKEQFKRDDREMNNQRIRLKTTKAKDSSI